MPMTRQEFNSLKAQGVDIKLYHHTNEAKRRMSLSKKGANNPCYGKYGAAHPCSGNKSEATRKRISESKKGKPAWNKGLTAQTDERVKKYAGKGNWMKGHYHTPETKLKMSVSRKGKNTWSKGGTLSPAHRQKIVENNKRLWANPEYAMNHLKKLRAGMKHSMTRPEVKLINIIEKYSLPFKYTGDGSFMIGGMNPDFVNCNGKKEVVEVFGDYWHSDSVEKRWRRTELGRIMAFHSFGFNCKIIWEHEINSLLEEEIVARLTHG